MRNLWHILANLACALWLGGLVSLFIFVVTLFHNDHALGVQAAPQLFEAFEIYQFFLAAAAIVFTFLCKRKVVAAILILAAICTFVTHFGLTPKILEMAHLGQTHTDEFGRVHGESMIVYMTQTILVFIAQISLSFRPRR